MNDNNSEIYKKRRLKLSRMIEDFLSAPIPPALSNIREMVKSMNIYEDEEDWDNMALAMIMSVVIKIIKTGHYKGLEFFVNTLKEPEEPTKMNNSYIAMIDAISKASENNKRLK